VIDEKGDVVQISNYYPFGTPYSAEDFATHNPDQQDRKYNGKEFDTTHGLNTSDYGARQYNSLVGRLDRIDPLCEKYEVFNNLNQISNPSIDGDLPIARQHPQTTFILKDQVYKKYKYYNGNGVYKTHSY